MATYTVTLSSGALNLRSGANSTASVLCTIPNYAQVTSAPIMITVPPQETQTDSEGTVWRRVSYNSQTGWVANKYLKESVVAAPKTIAQTHVATTPTTATINTNNSNTTNTMTLTDDMKKKVKIGGAIVVGVSLLGIGIYKMTKKKPTTATALSSLGLAGVSRKRRNSRKKGAARRTQTKVKAISLI
ncbi:MAG: SH3 domain-containing protein [Bacteroidales bacterium]|jgi:uncharacterized protein YraI|nr:SH3 domain-containing protein [Bacteroidales bacterium]